MNVLHVPVTRKRRKNKEDEKDKIKMNHEFFVFLKKKKRILWRNCRSACKETRLCVRGKMKIKIQVLGRFGVVGSRSLDQSF